MGKFRDEVVKILQKEINLSRAQKTSKDKSSEVKGEITLTIPPDPKMGDYSFPCFALAKKLGKNPKEMAEELLKKIQPTEYIERVEILGPYLNFFISKRKLNEVVMKAINLEKEGYGAGMKKKEKIMIEYHQPNTHKAFHIGHLRNAVLGDAVIRTLRYAGYKVVAATYMGDIGMHVAKVLWYLKKYHKGAYPKEDLGEWLGEVYVKAHKEYEKHPEHEKEVKEVLQNYEDGDKELKELWEKTRQWSLDAFHEIEKELKLNIDTRFYESEVEEEGKEMVMEAKKKGIVVESEGALIIDLEKYDLGVFLVLKNDGTSLYSTKDIALAKVKFDKHKIDQSLYVVGSEQKLYLQQLFKALELIGFKNADRCKHVSYELVTLKEGKMSSRAGTGISYKHLKEKMLEKALAEVKKRHKDWKNKDVEKAADQVAFAAMKFTMLNQDNNRQIVFDIEKALDFEGETGPYVQYAHARACSILRKSPIKTITKVKYEILTMDIEKKVVVTLNQFPEIIEQVSQSYKPMTLTRYVLDLAQAFNEFYHACPILKEEEETLKARLLIVDCVRQVLKNALGLLGIEAPEQM